MVKQQQQQLGGLITSLFSSSGGGSSKEVLPCPSTSSSMLSASSSSSSVWQWWSCGQPRTLSFRQEHQCFHGQHQQTTMKRAYKTINSAYSVDYSNSLASVDGSSFSEASGGGPVDDASSEAEAVISALRSDRLFFEPDASSSCIIEQAAIKKPNNNKLMMKAAAEDDDDHHHPTSNNKKLAAFGGATAMSVESQNPYRDFRESMEAVVMSHGDGVKDWRWLEEMLGWYLRANCKSTHGLIVGAFVDLLVSLSNTSLASSSPAASSSDYNDDDDCSSSSL